jgi:hypothetical protein
MTSQDLRLIKQEKTINEIKGILVIEKNTNEEIALIEVDQLIQFYNFNSGLSINIINTIVDIAKNFHMIYESL